MYVCTVWIALAIAIVVVGLMLRSFLAD